MHPRGAMGLFRNIMGLGVHSIERKQMSSLIFTGPQFGKQKHRGRWEERKEGANGGNVLICPKAQIQC